jgi:hypothetical protein
MLIYCYNSCCDLKIDSAVSCGRIGNYRISCAACGSEEANYALLDRVRARVQKRAHLCYNSADISEQDNA